VTKLKTRKLRSSSPRRRGSSSQESLDSRIRGNDSPEGQSCAKTQGRTKTVTVWHGKIPIESWYTPGVAGEKTLMALKNQGSFLATVCGDCNVTYFPARMFCERCFADILNNEKIVGPDGTLESWSVVTVDKDGKKLKKPQTFGLIKLDGTNTVFLHKLKSQALIGARVEPVLKDPAKRKGSVNDILHFKAAV